MALTEQQQKLITRALQSHPPTQIIAEGFHLQITRKDLQTLNGLNWLNDEVRLNIDIICEVCQSKRGNWENVDIISFYNQTVARNYTDKSNLIFFLI